MRLGPTEKVDGIQQGVRVFGNQVMQTGTSGPCELQALDASDMLDAGDFFLLSMKEDVSFEFNICLTIP